GSQYRVHLVPEEGEARSVVPLWAIRYAVNAKTQAVNAMVWPTSLSRGPSSKDLHKKDKTVSVKNQRLHLLEFDATLVAEKGEKPSLKFARSILGLAAHSGYHGVLVVGLFHAGVRATASLLAPTPVLKDAAEFTSFLHQAHDQDLAVFIEVPSRAIAGKSFLPPHFFADQGELLQRFDFSRKEVAQYLLYSLQHWVESGVDGFRLESLPGAAASPATPSTEDFVVTATGLLRSAASTLAREVLTIGVGDVEDGLCDPTESGGFGFDLCQAEQSPDYSQLVPGSHCTTLQDPAKAKPMQKLATALTKPLAARKDKKAQLVTCMETMEEFIVTQGPLRVCMLSWETMYTVSGGAAAPYVSGLAEALVQRGHEVHVFTRASHGMKINVETVKGVVYHEVPYTLSADFVEETANFCKALAAAVSAREATYGRFDIAHGHEWLVWKVRGELRKDLKFLLTVHSTEELRSRGAEYGGRSDLVGQLEGEAFRGSDQLLAASQTLRECMYAEYGLKGDIPVMHNGASMQEPSSEELQKEAREALGLPEKSPVLLYCGRLIPQKGADLLVEAIPFVRQHWQDAHFVIAGTGQLRAALERRCGELGLLEAVTFAKASSAEEQRRFLEACDAVVVPARQDFYGVGVIESWAAARPVVGNTCGELRHLIQPDVTGYMVDQEAGSLSWGLCKICENREHARWMGKQGWQQVQSGFLWDTMAKRTEDLYIELLGLQEAPHTPLPRRPRPLAQALGEDALPVLRLCRLLSLAFGGDGTLSCLGSDFGWNGKVDYPRKGNEYSDKLARIPTELARDKSSKNKFLAMFQMALLRTERCLQWLADPVPNVVLQEERKQALVLTRGCAIFAFNFSAKNLPSLSFSIPQLKGVSCEFKTVLNTQDHRFGGSATTAQCVVAVNDGEMQLFLVAQSAMVLAPTAHADALLTDKTLQLRSADSFIDLLDSAASPVTQAPALSFEDLAAAAREAAAKKQQAAAAAKEEAQAAAGANELPCLPKADARREGYGAAPAPNASEASEVKREGGGWLQKFW
ncbi:unnamed protein product, partial [Effrenium voratum]